MKRSEVKIEPAKPEHIVEFYGAPHKRRIRGYVAILEGQVVGVGGLSFERESVLLFSDIKDALRPFKKDIVKGLLILLSLIEKAKFPIFAIANKQEKMAERLLSRLGFIESGHSTDNGKIFWRVPIWQH